MNHVLIPLLLLALRCGAAPFTLDITVVDELGAPIPGAAVWVDAVPRVSSDPWNAPARRQRVEATADGQGCARLAGEHALGAFCPMAVAPGYYPTGARMKAGLPAIRLVLPRRLGHAASCRVDVLTRVLPDDGAEHGFDLVMGAFVAPIGVGRQVDVWIRGRCPSVRLAPGEPGAFADEAVMRFDSPGDGVVGTPRPGEGGFDVSVSPACAGMFFDGLLAPRVAPVDGYAPVFAYRSVRGPSATEIPGPGRVGQPQRIFRLHRDGQPIHGLIDDFGWMPDGRLRILYRISTEPGNRSLEFGP